MQITYFHFPVLWPIGWKKISFVSNIKLLPFGSEMSSSNETLKGGLTLCLSDLWNTEYTWYPENGPPDFTPCFHKTILVWVPCIQLWLTSVIEVQRAKSSNSGPIPWSFLNILKTLLLIMILATSTGQVWSLKLILSCIDYLKVIKRENGQSWNYHRKLRVRKIEAVFNQLR